MEINEIVVEADVYPTDYVEITVAVYVTMSDDSTKKYVEDSHNFSYNEIEQGVYMEWIDSVIARAAENIAKQQEVANKLEAGLYEVLKKHKYTRQITVRDAV